MKRLFAILLFVLGSGAIFLLQTRKPFVPVTPRPLLYILADTQQEMERIPFAVTHVSEKEEMVIGSQLAQQYDLSASQGQGPDSETITAYLNVVGRRVAANAHRKGIHYHFYFQNDANFVNAFALPGGNIVVGRGLLRLVESEDELAAVLGHEIAHVDNRDAIERLQYLMVSRKVGLDGIYQLGAPLVQIYEAGYAKEQEFEADRAGLGLAVAAGYSPLGGVKLMARFEKLEHDYSEHPLSGPVAVAQVPLSALEEYFRSHPPAAERRVSIEREIRVNGWSTGKPITPLAIRSQIGSANEDASL